MSFPVPRYEIGQQVWVIERDRRISRWPCPDCLDTKRWAATTPAGELIPIACPRCGDQWSSMPRNIPSLTKVVATARARQLTIGSVRVDTGETRNSPVSYMCVETGVGSGQIHYEDGVYSTEGEAQEAANQINLATQANLDAEPHALLAADYAAISFQQALASAWEEELYHGYDNARRYREAIDTVLEEDKGLSGATNDTLRESIEHRSWQRPQPLAVLVAAARAVALDYSNDTLQQLKEALKPLVALEARA